jgi:hypothetical protein
MEVGGDVRGGEGGIKAGEIRRGGAGGVLFDEQRLDQGSGEVLGGVEKQGQ